MAATVRGRSETSDGLVVVDIIVFWDKLRWGHKQCSLIALLSTKTHNTKWLLTYECYCKPLLRSHLYHFDISAIRVISRSHYMFRQEDGATDDGSRLRFQHLEGWKHWFIMLSIFNICKLDSMGFFWRRPRDDSSWRLVVFVPELTNAKLQHKEI